MEDIFSFNEEVISDEEFELDSDEIKLAKSMQSILAALDSRDFSYYDKFGSTQEERDKNWTSEGYPALRWLSSVGKSEIDWPEAKRQGRKKGDKKGPWPSTTFDTEYTSYYLLAVNEIANIRFWDLSQHKKMQFLLLSCVGMGNLPDKEGHLWPGMPKNKKGKNKIEKFLYLCFPKVNALEMKLLRKIYSDKNKLINLGKSYGLSDEQINDIVNENTKTKKK